MIDPLALDPYEQQLLTVFDSYDHENLGSLDKDGLIQLCQTLQLEEQSSDLINCLLDDQKRTRATFVEFKDALLQLLDNMQKQQQQNVVNETTKKDLSSIDSPSPEREVSPKFVYGSKKYGRRTRPKCDDITNNSDELLNDTKTTTIINVQRSNSQIEVSDIKKRRTNYKLKRCTSLPGTQQQIVGNFLKFQSEFNTELICDEKMLREAWKKLGVGKDGYLNQTELILVCDAIGLHKLAESVLKQLSYKLSLDINQKISFHELLEALKQDETWNDVLETNPVHDNCNNNDDDDDDDDNDNNDDITTNTTGQLCSDSITFQYIQHGPNGDGFINTSALIEMWESVGITSPKELLHELGFNDCEINIVELANVVEKEIKGMNETNRVDLQNPHVVLLQVNLTLYQMEIRCLKNIFEQMQAEREKLKFDVNEANNRAKLLAQEVDDNHIKMEQNTQNQVKLLEQRHNDIIKELQLQYTNDKEQLTLINQNLEMKITNLEQEINKLKNDLDITHTYSMNLEKENQSYNNKIIELKQIKNSLMNQVKLLEIEKNKFNEIENEKIQPLLKQLNDIQLENSKLRDRNDEMVTEIENLTKQINSMKMKVTNQQQQQNLDENISIINEGVGLGAKRRSDYSPTKDNILFGIADGSPRLGKLRKFHKDNLSLFETNQIDVDEMHLKTIPITTTTTLTDVNMEILQLQNRIVILEQVLKQHSIPIPNNETVDKETGSMVEQLMNRIKELASILNKLTEIKIMINKNGLNCDTLKTVGDNLETILTNIDDTKQTKDICINTDEESSSSSLIITDSLNNIIEKYQKDNNELNQKCIELENCLELLRNEYEKCEDYWQMKLDEERQIFEQEQHQNTEKLNELIQKMSEYEEQFTNQNIIDEQQQYRLPPIEENENLERQFTDLEQEFEDYKLNCQHQLYEKDKEIDNLKQKLNELKLRNTCEIGIQTTQNNDELYDKMKFNNLSLCLVETTNLYSSDATPLPITPPETTTTTTKESQFNWNKQQPSTSISPILEKNSTPCRPKRTRKHERNNLLYKKHNQDKDDKRINDNQQSQQEQQQQQQMVVVPIITIHNLNGRLHHLEQRCRQLQLVLKQQHYFTEQSLNQCRQHYRGENVELQFILKNQQEKLDQQVRICNEQLERLARSDMLVKELYVENSYLIAKVQRLEQQCHFLAQCNSHSCSV